MFIINKSCIEKYREMCQYYLATGNMQNKLNSNFLNSYYVLQLKSAFCFKNSKMSPFKHFYIYICIFKKKIHIHICIHILRATSSSKVRKTIISWNDIITEIKKPH